MAASTGRPAGSAGSHVTSCRTGQARGQAPAKGLRGARSPHPPPRPTAPHRLPHRKSRFCTAGTVELAFWPVTRWRSSTTCTASGSLAAGAPRAWASGSARARLAPLSPRGGLGRTRPGPPPGLSRSCGPPTQLTAEVGARVLHEVLHDEGQAGKARRPDELVHRGLRGEGVPTPGSGRSKSSRDTARLGLCATAPGGPPSRRRCSDNKTIGRPSTAPGRMSQ